MKNFFLTKILQYIGSKFDGKKTLFAGIGSILWGLVGLIGIIFPDQKLTEQTLEESMAYIFAGLGALGIGSKLQKQITATDTQTVAIVDSVQRNTVEVAVQGDKTVSSVKANTEAVKESAPCESKNPSGISPEV
jgi:hypothetical protein